ncbi:probable RNA helicase armi isoform X3 [Drosophila miranda]|uniref:probable RNA helicase armi isoform X3 n=1 Tax=Drosophila miranda TaxID=7229 RepID=UPI00143F069E|nr:probable RNA helicase armi isoform X3 [Drosophila miranda]XP_033242672.1 probable RNA helicase armi isoform X3 [Drosophila miranda]
MRAVFNILRGEAKNLPYVIFGPPGPGQTVTLVEAVLQMVQNRILVAAPSNIVADLISKLIIAIKALTTGEFIRIVRQSLIKEELIPPELMPHCATLDICAKETAEDTSTEPETLMPAALLSKDRGRVILAGDPH